MREAYLPNRKTGKDGLDYFPTPSSATEAFLRTFVEKVSPLTGRVWEPACGEGHISEVLKQRGLSVVSTDIKNYGYGDGFCSFLDGEHPVAKEVISGGVDIIITNPPYNIAEEFIHRALEVSNRWVMMLARLQFLESIGRYERLWTKTPPHACFLYAKRVHMVAGRLPNKSDGGSSLAFCWLTWDKWAKDEITRFFWIDNRFDEKQENLL